MYYTIIVLGLLFASCANSGEGQLQKVDLEEAIYISIDSVSKRMSLERPQLVHQEFYPDNAKKVSINGAINSGYFTDSTQLELLHNLYEVAEQRIIIEEIGSNKIRFEYYIRNIASNCNKSISGVAIDHHPDMDPELDEDEEGFGYPAIEYVYEEGGCFLAVRIAMKAKDKIQIQESGCNTANKLCPLTSIGVLR